MIRSILVLLGIVLLIEIGVMTLIFELLGNAMLVLADVMSLIARLLPIL